MMTKKKQQKKYKYFAHNYIIIGDEHELVAISEFLAFFLVYSVILKVHDPHKNEIKYKNILLIIIGDEHELVAISGGRKREHVDAVRRRIEKALRGLQTRERRQQGL